MLARSAYWSDKKVTGLKLNLWAVVAPEASQPFSNGEAGQTLAVV